jgi:hypothetical protein
MISNPTRRSTRHAGNPGADHNPTAAQVTVGDVTPWMNSYVQALGDQRANTILDAIMHHFDEISTAVGAAMQITLLAGLGFAGSPGVRSAAWIPGASVAKIGSSRVAASLSPPIMRQ